MDQRPLRELSGGAEPFCFSRGKVDVSGLRDLLDGDENVWGDAYAAADRSADLPAGDECRLLAALARALGERRAADVDVRHHGRLHGGRRRRLLHA